MQQIINKPLASTFGWLHMNGTLLEVPEEKEQESLVIPSSEKKLLILDNDTAAEALTAEVEEGALLQLIQISGPGSQQIRDIRVRCQKDARFEWYRLVLKSGEIYDNLSVTLEGNGSSFQAEIGYDLISGSHLDMNCEAIHLGKNTVSDIHSLGVLNGDAFKLLRGTIDLRRGCQGAKGKEFEDVLLLSDQAHNQSIPVILCAEEDVEGDHGATIGQIPEEVIFYLTSRGISEDAIYSLMARSKLEAVIRTLPDEQLKNSLLERESL